MKNNLFAFLGGVAVVAGLGVFAGSLDTVPGLDGASRSQLNSTLSTDYATKTELATAAAASTNNANSAAAAAASAATNNTASVVAGAAAASTNYANSVGANGMFAWSATNVALADGVRKTIPVYTNETWGSLARTIFTNESGGIRVLANSTYKVSGYASVNGAGSLSTWNIAMQTGGVDVAYPIDTPLAYQYPGGTWMLYFYLPSNTLVTTAVYITGNAGTWNGNNPAVNLAVEKP